MQSEKIREIISQMTLDEKVRCCALFEDRFGKVPRLELPGYRSCDNPSGGWIDYLRVSEEKKKEHDFWGTSFPQAAALGSSWDEELAYEVGDAIGQECKHNSVDILLRPGVNMKRSPLCGRNFEYFSEDPILSGEMGAAYIRGVQKNHVAACLKHYAANNQEFERMTTNAVVSERALHEIYLRAFEIAIEKGDPWTMMSCYNKVNGEWVHANKMLMDILRKDFGFKGLLMSDAMAVHYDKVDGHKCGLDVELDETAVHGHQLLNAVYSGEIREEVLDEIAYRVIETYYKINESTEKPDVDLKAHHELAKRAAISGAVLLKNEGILPLDSDTGEKIAVIGAFAKEPSYMGGGSGHMNGHTVDKAFDEIARIASKAQISYAAGYQIEYGFPPADIARPDLVAEAVETAKAADVVLLFTGYPYGVESEGYDRDDLFLQKSHRELIEAVLTVNENVILIINTGAPVDLSAYHERVRAILQGGYCGEASGSASAEILFGLAEPGGRLAETYPLRLEDTPAYMNYPKYPNPMPDVVYGEDIYIGYRWYDTRKLDVLYPFGFGLSYTSFEYSDVRLSRTEIGKSDPVTVTLKVKNTGKRAGSDVVQVYVGNKGASVTRPEKELKGFKKVYLEAGEEKEVSIILDKRSFEVYTPAGRKWIVEDGVYEILVGRSSRDILWEGSLTVKSDDKAVYFHDKLPVVWYTKEEDRFAEALADAEQETQDFFNIEKNPILPLVMPLPWKRFKEVGLTNGKVTDAVVNSVVEKMNQ